MSVELPPGNWFWCGLCETVAYQFDCCNNTTCNGGGCDKCSTPRGSSHNEEASRMIAAGEHPDVETLEKRSTPEQLDALFGGRSL